MLAARMVEVPRREPLVVTEVGKGFREEATLKLGIEACIGFHQGRTEWKAFWEELHHSSRSSQGVAGGTAGNTGSRRKDLDGAQRGVGPRKPLV